MKSVTYSYAVTADPGTPAKALLVEAWQMFTDDPTADDFDRLLNSHVDYIDDDTQVFHFRVRVKE